MDNKNIKQIIKSTKLTKYKRVSSIYKFVNITDYKKLKPYQYTILLKNINIITKIDDKKETQHKLKRGDYVICGEKNEKYGLSLDKVLNTYNLGNIVSKSVIRKGIKLTKKNTNKKTSKSEIEIIPSWGGKQYLQTGDYILMELDSKKYYGINNKAFKKTYKKILR
jgi:hypothetical protein